MNLNSKAHKIFEVFNESFQEKYKNFSKDHKETLRAEGKIMEHF